MNLLGIKVGQREALELLEIAKQKFETVGWWRGGAVHLVSRDVWAEGASFDTAGDTCRCLATSVNHSEPALRYIRIALGVVTNTAVYDLNDSQPATNEGRLWAISIIDRAIALVEADLASEEN